MSVVFEVDHSIVKSILQLYQYDHIEFLYLSIFRFKVLGSHGLGEKVQKEHLDLVFQLLNNEDKTDRYNKIRDETLALSIPVHHIHH